VTSTAAKPVSGRSAAPPATVELIVRIHEIAWTNDAGDFAIAKGGATVARDGALPGRVSVTVKGPVGSSAAESLKPGGTYRMFGRWERHDKYGEQFCFSTFAHHLENTRAGVLAYLTAVVESVGAVRAEKLWNRFGADAVATLRHNPQAVADAGIMPLGDAQTASQSLHGEAAFESVRIDLMGLLAGRGFQAGKIIKLALAKFGGKAGERLRANPWIMMLRKWPSAGFKRCDKLYLDGGGNPSKLKRQVLAIWHYLRSESSGNTWHLRTKVAQALWAELPKGKPDPDRALALGIRAKWLTEYADKDGVRWIAESEKAWNEQTIAKRFLALSPNWTPTPSQLSVDTTAFRSEADKQLTLFCKPEAKSDLTSSTELPPSPTQSCPAPSGPTLQPSPADLPAISEPSWLQHWADL
jgi:hypothetical protein